MSFSPRQQAQQNTPQHQHTRIDSCESIRNEIAILHYFAEVLPDFLSDENPHWRKESPKTKISDILAKNKLFIAVFSFLKKPDFTEIKLSWQHYS